WLPPQQSANGVEGQGRGRIVETRDGISQLVDSLHEGINEPFHLHAASQSCVRQRLRNLGDMFSNQVNLQNLILQHEDCRRIVARLAQIDRVKLYLNRLQAVVERYVSFETFKATGNLIKLVARGP